MAGPHTVQVTSQLQRDFVVGVHTGFRFTVQVTAAQNMSAAIFAYRALPLQPGQDSAVGFFSHVCSAADLAEYPETQPRINDTPPWFRLSRLDVVVATRELAEHALEQIRADIQILLKSLDAQTTLDVPVTVTLGGTAP